MAEHEVEIGLPDLKLDRRQITRLEERLNSVLVEELEGMASAAKSKTKEKIKSKAKIKTKTRDVMGKEPLGGTEPLGRG